MIFILIGFDWSVLFFAAALCAAAGASRYERRVRPDDPQPATEKEADRLWSKLRRKRWQHSLFAAWVFLFACRGSILLAALIGSPFTFFVGGLVQPEAGLPSTVRSFFSFDPFAVTTNPFWERLLLFPLLAIGSLIPAALAAMTAAFFRRSREF